MEPKQAIREIREIISDQLQFSPWHKHAFNNRDSPSKQSHHSLALWAKLKCMMCPDHHYTPKLQSSFRRPCRTLQDELLSVYEQYMNSLAHATFNLSQSQSRFVIGSFFRRAHCLESGNQLPASSNHFKSFYLICNICFVLKHGVSWKIVQFWIFFYWGMHCSSHRMLRGITEICWSRLAGQYPLVSNRHALCGSVESHRGRSLSNGIR